MFTVFLLLTFIFCCIGLIFSILRWLMIFLIGLLFLVFSLAGHAATLGMHVGYMPNKAGGAVVLTTRHTRQCRAAWYSSFTTDNQNRVVRQGCWREEGTMVYMKFISTDAPDMSWPRSWFTFNED